MLIAGIESSCDETAVAIVRDGREVLSSVVASQTDLHALFGGVVPEVASREHLRRVAPLFDQAAAEAGVDAEALDAVAVTQGPGLIGALLVGVSFAKGLASSLGKPLIPIDHVHAHVHGAFLGLTAAQWEEFSYPVLALVVSGGHTNLYAMTAPTRFELMGSSIDDACGECFDKVGKLLELPYPGGPQIETWAKEGRADSYPMPRMVQEKRRLAFSYSGLKTHVATRIGEDSGLVSDPEKKADLCASFQEEALGQLVRKLKTGCEMRPDARGVVIAGGVACNGRFREMVADELPVEGYFPLPRYCADNAAMIAAYGYHLYQENPKIADGASWDAYSRYAFEAVTP